MEQTTVTRVNLVPPSELQRQHLVAEYREISRVFALARRWHEAGRPQTVPDIYGFGTGHVRFFYTRLGFVTRRHRLLVREFWERGYAPTFEHTLGLLLQLPADMRRLWEPSEQDIAVSRQRISERLR